MSSQGEGKAAVACLEHSADLQSSLCSLSISGHRDKVSAAVSLSRLLLQTTLTFNPEFQFGLSETPTPVLRQPLPLSPTQKGKEKLTEEKAVTKEAQGVKEKSKGEERPRDGKGEMGEKRGPDRVSLQQRES